MREGERERGRERGRERNMSLQGQTIYQCIGFMTWWAGLIGSGLRLIFLEDDWIKQ